MPYSIHYDPQLTSLVNLVKSNTPEGDLVMEVLRTGDEPLIREMLRNFGKPGTQWESITTAFPWTDWQIDQAVTDLNTIKPDSVKAQSEIAADEGVEGISFWAW